MLSAPNLHMNSTASTTPGNVLPKELENNVKRADEKNKPQEDKNGYLLRNSDKLPNPISNIEDKDKNIEKGKSVYHLQFKQPVLDEGIIEEQVGSKSLDKHTSERLHKTSCPILNPPYPCENQGAIKKEIAVLSVNEDSVQLSCLAITPTGKAVRDVPSEIYTNRNPQPERIIEVSEQIESPTEGNEECILNDRLKFARLSDSSVQIVEIPMHCLRHITTNLQNSNPLPTDSEGSICTEENALDFEKRTDIESKTKSIMEDPEPSGLSNVVRNIFVGRPFSLQNSSSTTFQAEKKTRAMKVPYRRSISNFASTFKNLQVSLVKKDKGTNHPNESGDQCDLTQAQQTLEIEEQEATESPAKTSFQEEKYQEPNFPELEEIRGANKFPEQTPQNSIKSTKTTIISEQQTTRTESKHIKKISGFDEIGSERSITPKRLWHMHFQKDSKSNSLTGSEQILPSLPSISLSTNVLARDLVKKRLEQKREKRVRRTLVIITASFCWYLSTC